MALHTLRRRALALLATFAVASGLAVGFSGAAQASTPTVNDAYYDAVHIYAQINSQRAAAHVAGLSWSNQLVVATQVHNAWMYRSNLLSHQCPGEPSLGARISATGYRWRTVGEEIGVTTDWSYTGLLNLEKMLYNDAAHRAILLNTAYRNMAVHVLMDAGRHKAWLTIDFAAPL
jgi:uncharacterized protein YkwD